MWLSCLECPVYQNVAGSIPHQGTYLGCRFGPLLGHGQEATDWCFSSPLWSPFPSLKSISMTSGKDKKRLSNINSYIVNLENLFEFFDLVFVLFCFLIYWGKFRASGFVNYICRPTSLTASLRCVALCYCLRDCGTYCKTGETPETLCLKSPLPVQQGSSFRQRENILTSVIGSPPE